MGVSLIKWLTPIFVKYIATKGELYTINCEDI